MIFTIYFYHANKKETLCAPLEKFNMKASYNEICPLVFKC